MSRMVFAEKSCIQVPSIIKHPLKQKIKKARKNHIYFRQNILNPVFHGGGGSISGKMAHRKVIQRGELDTFKLHPMNQ